MGNINTISTQGVVLRTAGYSENDVVLTMYTRGLGKVTAIAKGAKRNRSPFTASSQLFSFSEFVLKKQRGMYRVIQADIIKSFYDISYDLDAFSYASYISRLVENSSLENQTNHRLFNMLVKTLYLLSEKGTDKEFITAAFELKFSDYMGICPVVDVCSLCGDYTGNYSIFNIEEGGMVCKRCAGNLQNNIILDVTTKKLMKYILENNIETVSRAKVNRILTKELSKLMKKYMTAYMSNLNLKSLNILYDLNHYKKGAD